ncbi:hypothetical protein J3459_022349, partial [Metarhizium acridum]
TNHLGKFAYEDEMPSWLARRLAKGGQICTDGKKPADKRPIMAYYMGCSMAAKYVV